MELRRGDVSAWGPPPWLVTRTCRLADVVALEGTAVGATLRVRLRVQPAGGSRWWVEGEACVEPPAVRPCCVCGALACAGAASHAFETLVETPARRGQRGLPDDGDGGAADDAVLLWPSSSPACDLTPLVRDCLLLAVPIAPRCAACAAAPQPPLAAISSTITAAGTLAGSPFAKLAALRRRTT